MILTENETLELLERWIEQIDVDEDSDEFKFYRQMAKAVTLGTIYGIGNKKLSIQLGITPREAGQYKRTYFQGLRGSKEFFDSVKINNGGHQI